MDIKTIQHKLKNKYTEHEITFKERKHGWCVYVDGYFVHIKITQKLIDDMVTSFGESDTLDGLYRIIDAEIQILQKQLK